jgi:tetratricopeptide (TPR) repeat protein
MPNFFLKIKAYLLLFLIIFSFSTVHSETFSDKLRDIRAEINRDDLQEALKKIKKISISTEHQQEQINILFGDIYLKINQPQKAEEFYQESFFTSNPDIEVLALIGLAELRLLQGKLNDAIDYAQQSINVDQNKVRPKIILAIAKTRIGEGEEGIKILNELYASKRNAEVALAISGYYSAFDDSKQAIKVLEDFIKRDLNNIKIINQLAGLYLIDGNKIKALEYKIKRS